MINIRVSLQLLVAVFLFSGIISPVTYAQKAPGSSGLTFNSFTGTYHLSRDASNQSLLTSEEVILADFASNSQLTGIIRSIPKSYQGENVEIKVLHATDAAGNDIPFKTSSKGDNLEINIGDPKIYLYGSQTFRLTYQTKNVINLNTSENEFILNVNGRGWNQGFGKVRAFLHIPTNVSSSIKSDSSCYIGYMDTSTLDCQIKQQKSAQETLITSESTRPLNAHEALVVKTAFKTATFSANKGSFDIKLPVVFSLILIAALGTVFWRSKKT